MPTARRLCACRFRWRRFHHCLPWVSRLICSSRLGKPYSVRRWGLPSCGCRFSVLFGNSGRSAVVDGCPLSWPLWCMPWRRSRTMPAQFKRFLTSAVRFFPLLFCSTFFRTRCSVRHPSPDHRAPRRLRSVRCCVSTTPVHCMLNIHKLVVRMGEYWPGHTRTLPSASRHRFPVVHATSPLGSQASAWSVPRWSVTSLHFER